MKIQKFIRKMSKSPLYVDQCWRRDAYYLNFIFFSVKILNKFPLRTNLILNEYTHSLKSTQRDLTHKKGKRKAIHVIVVSSPANGNRNFLF